MAKRASSAWPLRWVVGWRETVPGILREVLECGHIINGKQDAYGPYYANRRRCAKCKTGRPPDDVREP